jgi:hypothetical protein
MDDKVRQALEARFPDNAVKQRRGSFGKEISYVDGQAVVARLNDCFDGDFSYSILSSQVLDTGEVLVHGRLTVLGSVTKEAYGKSCPAVSRETGEVLSMADAYKAAATDALKKCATLLGVAAYLYCDEYQNQNDQPERLVPRPTQNNGDSITQKQLAYLWRCARENGLSVREIREMSLRDYGAVPEKLFKATASKFIERILAHEDRGAA